MRETLPSLNQSWSLISFCYLQKQAKVFGESKELQTCLEWRCNAGGAAVTMQARMADGGLSGILDLIKLFPCLTADLCLDFLQLEKNKLRCTEGHENRALVFQYLRSFLVDAYTSSVFLEKVTQSARCAAYLGPAAVFPSPPGSSTLRLLWTSSKHTPGLRVGDGVVTLTRWQSSNSTQCFFLHPQTQKNSSLNYKCLLGGGHFLNALKYPIAADCY